MLFKRFFFFLFIVLVFQIEGLHRDYYSSWDYCYYHLTPALLRESELTTDLAKIIPHNGKRCKYVISFEPLKMADCINKSIYPGYVDFDFNKYRNHLKRQLEYYKNNSYCNCYWPEYSIEAAEINNLAYLLFEDLFLSTSLYDLTEDYFEQQKFICTSSSYLSFHEILVALVAREFHFVDYYNVCKDIEEYSKTAYSEIEYEIIRNKIGEILEILHDRFLKLYCSCYNKHPNIEIENEIFFLKLYIGEIFDFTSIDYVSKIDQLDFISDFKRIHKRAKTKNRIRLIDRSVKPTKPKTTFCPESDILTEQGTILNNLLLHKEAINTLTNAINLNPSNRNAYLERALAYFETDQLDMALMDYQTYKKLVNHTPFKNNKHYFEMIENSYNPMNKIEFSGGMIKGIKDGAKDSAKEFVPSTLDCFRGILYGLWAFACSPIEISQEMASAAYSIGEFLYSHNSEECLFCVIPELRELSLTWNSIDEYSKGQKIGYLIGKYGVDIFAPIGAIKGVNKLKALKRANVISTLEICSESISNRTLIVEESAKRAKNRSHVLACSKNKILTKSSNVKYHVMQKKHAWDKIIPLSGNVEDDFIKIISIIEEHDLINEKYLRSATQFPRNLPVKNLLLLEYKSPLGNFEVQIFLEKYMDSGEIFLKNAWVITR